MVQLNMSIIFIRFLRIQLVGLNLAREGVVVEQNHPVVHGSDQDLVLESLC